MSFVGMYTAEVYKCANCGTVDELAPTEHSEEQWRDRSRIPNMEVITAWNEGIKIYDHGFDAEVARYHHPSRIVLLQKCANIVTCIHIPTGKYTGQRASIQAMVREGASSTKIANLLNECDINKSGFEEIVREMDCADRGDGSAESTAASAGTNTPGRQQT